MSAKSTTDKKGDECDYPGGCNRPVIDGKAHLHWCYPLHWSKIQCKLGACANTDWKCVHHFNWRRGTCIRCTATMDKIAYNGGEVYCQGCLDDNAKRYKTTGISPDADWMFYKERVDVVRPVARV